MPELWCSCKMRSLKDEIDAFRSTLKYGDPLVVTRPFGKGRVLAFLTTAGTLRAGPATTPSRGTTGPAAPSPAATPSSSSRCRTT